MSVRMIWVADHIVASTDVHEHDYYQLMYCKSGVGEILIGNTVYTAVPGNAYLSFSMQKHALIQKDRLHLVEVKFFLDDPLLSEEIRRIPPEFSIDDNLLLRIAFAELKREALSGLLYSNESTNAVLQLFLLRLIRQTYSDVKTEGKNYQNCFFNTKEYGRNESDAEIALLKIIDYIETNLSEQFTLDDLTKVVHFDKSYLISKFKKIWGVPPIQYANHLRIERAKVLLSVTDKSITEIAQEVGFKSIHYFSRYFKAKEEITPNEYREKRRSFMLNKKN